MGVEGWENYKLSEIVEIIGGGTPKTSMKEYWNGDIPWLSVKDFNNDFRTVVQSEKTITKQGLENSSAKLLDKGDIVISARGTVGELTQLGRPMSFNQSCYGLKAKKVTTNDFVYYLLKHQIKDLQQKTHGSVFDTITKNTFNMLDVVLPPLQEQKQIAAILSALDDKIELNHRISQTLEAMAQALFQSWFVDFEPFRDGEFVESELGLIPKGWEVVSLDQIASFLNGIAMQKFPPEGREYLPVIKIKELRQGFTDQNSGKVSTKIQDQYIVNNGDVVFSWSGTLECKIWCGGKGALNQHLFKVTSNRYEKWFFYFWIQKHLERFRRIALDKATTMGHIKRKDLNDSKVLIPNDEIYTEINRLIKPLIEKYEGLLIETQTLQSLRDTLLPKLMSGEIRVPIEEKEASHDRSDGTEAG
ncbi:type I restriction endonuclease MjaXP subunit S [Kroppenstedtia guangzhouensis]|uniref:Type I restriction endonuclease MjaXP subunit S n=1 Tax=Kroppenstedtia guangzhouensis TaxID=1274356 RepID=A0ABQ1GSY5_9BACL|nr:restriction endonuclease subunit S [Kroppenstedtia guangzhouensis]GGA49791.1 type I restriction endonuclease MjaXP subunit S [Kroppenstedtia guangzhouensis]